jgi:hypothetical protein
MPIHRRRDQRVEPARTRSFHRAHCRFAAGGARCKVIVDRQQFLRRKQAAAIAIERVGRRV